MLPVDGDAGDGEGRDEGDADRDHARQLADDLHVRAGPPLEEDLDEGHGGDDGAEEEVAHGQVHDQYVVHLQQLGRFSISIYSYVSCIALRLVRRQNHRTRGQSSIHIISQRMRKNAIQL